MISIALIVKNESRYLAEWISYYDSLGVVKFYIYLHNCNDNSLEIIKQFDLDIDVEIVNENNYDENFQGSIYNNAIFRCKTEWIVCLDIDEFLFLPSSSLHTFLEQPEFKKCGAIALYQNVFGSSGHIKSPDGLVIDNYICRNSDNIDPISFIPNFEQPLHMFYNIKPIIKTKKAVGMINAHRVASKSPIVTSEGKIHSFIKDLRTTDQIVINHYFTKSREDWDQKIRRKRITTRPSYKDHWFDYVDNLSFKDTQIKDKYGQDISRKLNSNPS